MVNSQGRSVRTWVLPFRPSPTPPLPRGAPLGSRAGSSGAVHRPGLAPPPHPPGGVPLSRLLHVSSGSWCAPNVCVCSSDASLRPVLVQLAARPAPLLQIQEAPACSPLTFPVPKSTPGPRCFPDASPPLTPDSCPPAGCPPASVGGGPAAWRLLRDLHRRP